MNTGQIVKSKGENPYAQIPNKMLRDERLSAKAKGLLCLLLSLPSDWVIYRTTLSQYFKDGYDAINSGWKELEELGYIVSVQMIDKDSGQFGGYNYIVYFESSEDRENTGVLTESGFSRMGKPQMGKSAPTNKEHTKKKSKYLFSDFWQLYGKKIGRKTAEGVWNKMNADEKDMAVDGMGNHKSGKLPKYWKDPERYLKDRRWEDEPEGETSKKPTIKEDNQW
jgi:hypothetical protein